MSLWVDAVMEQLEDGEIDEDHALKLVFALATKYQWNVNIWQPSDVLVLREDEDPDEADLYDGERPELTEPMRWAIYHTWAWRKGINEIANERTYEMVPRIVVREDGSFVVHADADKVLYAADGSTPDSPFVE